ncbi:MAG: DegV family protein [Lachnospiraceae bacterium]|nr:DegV family protein [Lachnospiraceae bacterium]
MHSILVATDSHSGLSPEAGKKLGVSVLPMPFFFGEECYYEEVSLTRKTFFERLNAGETVSTSQPSPEAVMEFWREGLKEYESILYVPMSSGLSGSCNTAMMLAQDEEFEGKVVVVDNGRVSTPLVRALMDALEMVEEGLSAEKIKEVLEAEKEKMSIYIAVETLEFLQKGGRISATTAALGTMLNIKPILKLGTNLLETYKKSRGMKKAKKEMLEAIQYDLENTFKEYHERGEAYLLAATSANEEETAAWVEEIKEAFPGMDVLAGNLSLGICCHTGEGALGVGISCRPRR